MNLPIKRQRSANFTGQEKLILLELVKEHKEILENKKTDKYWVSEKLKVWELIADKFNSESATKRESKSLKTCYENIRHDAIKERAADRADTYLTGGGPKSVTIRKVSEVALEIIKDKVTPLVNPFDSSAQYNNDVITAEEGEYEVIQVIDFAEKPVVIEIDDSQISYVAEAKENRPPRKSLTTPSPVVRGSTKSLFSSLNTIVNEKTNKYSSKLKYFERVLEEEEKHLLEIKLLQKQIDVANQQLKKEKLEEEKKNIEIANLSINFGL